jgi:hypothetical protein
MIKKKSISKKIICQNCLLKIYFLNNLKNILNVKIVPKMFYSNVSGGGNCEAIPDRVGVSL